MPTHEPQEPTARKSHFCAPHVHLQFEGSSWSYSSRQLSLTTSMRAGTDSLTKALVTLSRLGGRPWWSGKVGGWSGKVLGGRRTRSRCSRLFWTVQNSREWSEIIDGRVGDVTRSSRSFRGRSVVVNTVGRSRAWSGKSGTWRSPWSNLEPLLPSPLPEGPWWALSTTSWPFWHTRSVQHRHHPTSVITSDLGNLHVNSVIMRWAFSPSLHMAYMKPGEVPTSQCLRQPKQPPWPTSPSL